MSYAVSFFFLLISNVLLTGLMYSLIALGFVLVYKATDAINFAQGEFVMIAGFVGAGGLVVWGARLSSPAAAPRTHPARRRPFPHFPGNKPAPAADPRRALHAGPDLHPADP